jgi:hypothetical protein
MATANQLGALFQICGLVAVEELPEGSIGMSRLGQPKRPSRRCSAVEGCDTPVLKEAKALLDELSS